MNEKIQLNKNDFTLPVKFYAAGTFGGIKKNRQLDMGFLFSELPCQTAGLFTTSKFTGHCIDICRTHLAKKKDFYGVLATSGNSNTATGPEGRTDSLQLLENLKNYLQQKKGISLPDNPFLISHTGVIGFRLPLNKMLFALPELANSVVNQIKENEQKKYNEDNYQKIFTESIMTTDTKPKGGSVTVQTTDGSFRISGVVKGAGMIAPNMATMLCYVTTDAAVNANDLQTALSIATEQSFNSITIDGDMSPDDTILLFANGSSQVAIDHPAKKDLFQNALNALTLYLAKEMIIDGEGATKLIEIHVKNALNPAEAKKAGLAIANSLLVKTAFFGEDANWGRILTALGYSGVEVDINRVSLHFGDYPLFLTGAAISFEESVLKNYLSQNEVKLSLDLAQGNFQRTIYTCDLSIDYVKINADYRS